MEDPDKTINNARQCEAWFYAGSKRLIEGDKTIAANYFTKALATKLKLFQDYQSAEAELKYLQTANS